MNYLGHLYFSDDQHSLMLANLYGDFFKGRQFDKLPSVVRQGVRLHREIDDYFDHHPAIRKLRKILAKDLPKIAGIAIDLYIDHLLAQYWTKYCHRALPEFLNDFFRFTHDEENLNFPSSKNFKYPDSFIFLIRLIEEKNWILRYRSLEGLDMACYGLSKRISFQNNLDTAPIVYHFFQQDIFKAFECFMQDARRHFPHS